MKAIDYSLKIWTGISETLELPDADSVMTKIMVTDSTFNSQPVPQYLWKVSFIN